MRTLLLTAVAVMGLGLGSAWVRGEDKPADDKAAGTVSGVLIDNHCAAKQMEKDNPEEAAAQHAKACALKEGCAKEGYCIITGKTAIKLDDAGNKMAKEYLAKPESSTKVIAEGKRSDDGATMSLTSIKADPKAQADDEKKSDDKKTDDKKTDEKMEGKMTGEESGADKMNEQAK